jgi:hypothetical protein
LPLILAAASVVSGRLSARAADDPAGIEFFEKKVRPVLIDHCYPCHSAKSEKVRGGLLLDTRDGLRKGGETGPAIVPGDPEKSLLISAVRYKNADLRMPPKGKKLSTGQIADLETWVKMGAPDPRTQSVAATKASAASKHWAFQPVSRPPAPAVKQKKWVQNPIDAFVLAKLESLGLHPSEPADKRTLIRRATYDLTGLPPSAQDVDAFEADSSPDAYEKLIEKLLASPRYGERWGRYWLDVARYADTKGYVFEEDRHYPYSYTYRDYVIRSLNEDLPYDQFVIQQLAADLLPAGEDKRSLAALGYLTLGRRFLNNQNDIIDDRIDVTCRGLMGLTVGCARCHDHKFDPIPTRDYYSLYGVFESCTEPSPEPLLGVTPDSKEYKAFLAEHKRREEKVRDYRAQKEAEALTAVRAQSGDYLLAIHDTHGLTNAEKDNVLIQGRKLSPIVAERWKNFLAGKKSGDPIFGPWLELAQCPTNEFSAKAKEIAATPTNALNPLIAARFQSGPTNLQDAADRYNTLFAEIDRQWTKLAAAAVSTNSTTNAPKALPDPNAEALRQVLYADDSPAHLDDGQIHSLFDTPTAQTLRRYQRELDELEATDPGAPPRAMALNDLPQPAKPHVFLRGNPSNPGPEVPRQFLAVVEGDKRHPFEHGSGRLEMAHDIASPDNPLTARVIVNRVWLHHFGTGLVGTPSDFGTRSDPPTNPQLLDYLASRFVEEGWSIKKLHRWIMLSSTYRQGSENDSRAVRVDPENKYLWRMNRQRLDFEAMRDSLLSAAGRLDLSVGGRSVDIIDSPFSTRRAVYGFIDRQNLPNLFRTFDFANPDATNPRRFYTTVPQQALFLMNSPFVLEQARHLVQEPEFERLAPARGRIEYLYRAAYQRKPAGEEVSLAEQFLKQGGKRTTEQPKSVWEYGYGHYDAASQRVDQFHPLSTYSNDRWQNSAQFPDSKLGYAMLNAQGGHPGNSAEQAVVRRWTAPFDGEIRIKGSLNHLSDKGDGVLGRVVSSRNGKLGEWIAFDGKKQTKVEHCEVKRGDTIDFIIDPRENPGYDSFDWAPLIEASKISADASAPAQKSWDAHSEFAGPSTPETDTWERLAQVLLLSNEFFFVD